MKSGPLVGSALVAAAPLHSSEKVSEILWNILTKVHTMLKILFRFVREKILESEKVQRLRSSILHPIPAYVIVLSPVKVNQIN